MKQILVTGANGQLANCLKDLVSEITDSEFTFLKRSELDISNTDNVEQVFNSKQWDFCINCGAYTAVDKAESEVEQAFSINKEGAFNLAKSCKENNTKLIHISTDFVFSGEQQQPYIETDQVAPLGVYGDSKLQGEEAIRKMFDQYFIIRTSWLYSEHGNNFMKTMLSLSADKSELGVVADQFGTPTYAKDLARFILRIVNADSQNYGIYHYSNLGETSWFGFAEEIFRLSNIDINLKGIATSEYLTPAKRPEYSVLDKSKTISVFDIEIPAWQDALKEALSNL